MMQKHLIIDNDSPNLKHLHKQIYKGIEVLGYPNEVWFSAIKGFHLKWFKVKTYQEYIWFAHWYIGGDPKFLMHEIWHPHTPPNYGYKAKKTFKFKGFKNGKMIMGKKINEHKAVRW